MKRLNTPLVWMIAAVLAICLLYLGYHYLYRQNIAREQNPYAYNIDAYKVVDPELINYKEIDSIELEQSETHSMATGAKNEILIGADSKLLVYSRGGTLETDYDLAGPAYCLAVGGDGEIYVGMRDHIEVYSPDGERLQTWPALGENSRLTSIAIVGDSLFAADYGNRRVWRLDMSGRVLANLEGSLPGHPEAGFVVPSPCFDVAAGPDSSLWIANPGGTVVQRYSPQGELLESWGQSSMEIEGFSGCCNPSHLAFTPDGKLITAEKGMPRVKEYNLAGGLESVVAAPSEFNKATGYDGSPLIKDLAVNPDGEVLVLDNKLGQIRIFKQL